MNYLRAVRVGSLLAILLVLAGTNDMRSQQNEALDVAQFHQQALNVLVRSLDDPDQEIHLAALRGIAHLKISLASSNF